MKLRITIAAIAAVLIVPALSAQMPSFTAASSPTSEVTWGLFGTDVDDAQDVNNWSDVEFGKGLGFVRAGAGVDRTLPLPTLGAGFATTIGNLFLGITYDGNLWDGSASVRKEDGDAADTTFADDVRFNNRLDLLIGSESFGGIKLVVFLDDFGIDTDENDALDTKLVESNGSIYAAGVWGKNFSLGGGTLKPEFALGAQFDVDGNLEGKNGSTTVTINNGYTSVMLRAAADYEFASQGSTTSTLSGDYTFILNLKPDALMEVKNGSYSYTVVAGDYFNVTGTIPGTIIPISSAKISDKGAFIMNALNLSYGQRYEIDGNTSVAWKAGAGLGFDFNETKFSGNVGGSDITLKGTAVTTFSITPAAAVAFGYTLPGKPFTLNAGVQLSAGFVLEKTEDKENKIVTTRYSFAEASPPNPTLKYGDPLTTTFGIGGTLKPTESFTLDAYLENTATTYLDGFAFRFSANNIVVGFLLGFKF